MSPMAAPHPCTWPGCRELVRGASRCEPHRRRERREYEAGRGSSAARGYGPRWREAREKFLAARRFCELCSRPDRPVTATEVDHRKPHRGDRGLFWDANNWQALRRPCHSRKTAREDGRWGR